MLPLMAPLELLLSLSLLSLLSLLLLLSLLARALVCFALFAGGGACASAAGPAVAFFLGRLRLPAALPSATVLAADILQCGDGEGVGKRAW